MLDEVDAALDNTNVSKLASYIRGAISDTFQVIAISLKPSFFERADGLVGIYRDVDAASSASVTVRDSLAKQD